MGTVPSRQNCRVLVYLVYPVDILSTPGIFKDWNDVGSRTSSFINPNMDLRSS